MDLKDIITDIYQNEIDTINDLKKLASCTFTIAKKHNALASHVTKLTIILGIYIYISEKYKMNLNAKIKNLTKELDELKKAIKESSDK